MANTDAPFELNERLVAPARADLSAYAYDAPWQRDEPAEEDEAPFPEPTFGEEFAEEDDFADRDAELFDALDAALDELADEQRIEAVREVAAPQFDALEVTPDPQTQYRDALRGFLGDRTRARAPRFTRPIRTFAANPGLNELLDDGLHRARLSREQRRAVGPITDPSLRRRLIY